MDMNQVNNSEPQRKSLWSERILHGVLRLRKNITVPLALLIILSAGTFSGIGFFMQNQNLEAEISRLESNSELQSLKMSNEWLKNRVAVLQEERAHLLDTAVADLNEKGMLIESILESVGVDIKVKVSKENSGGPFTGSMGATKDQLILRTDKYLDAIKDVPLGAPVPGVLTSRFGWRKDPINGKSAYHQGVDIRGRAGSEVLATADGIVKKVSYDKGNGRFVLIDHGNGFNTKYAHMKKSLVKKGKIIERGQVIGLVGSSGRSTGPHVHYEIHYDDKILNPTRFVRVAKYLNRPKKKQ
jgi:murein DD-endopeptidase MepM/ murein hydrolase activator NlpD